MAGTDADRDRLDGAPAFRGSNQSGMRAYNERLVLSLIRRYGALAKAEIARLTGLSAQTVSVIMRALERDGLLLRGAPIRGRVGQPSIPMRLADGGAYFFGLKIGRRSVELVLIDFLGRVLGRRRRIHDYPRLDDAVGFARAGIAELSRIVADERDRIGGLGIGMPFQLWDWAGRLGVPPEAMTPWQRRDIAEEIGAGLPFPVYLANDASAACNAEIVFGTGDRPQSFVYVYVGYFAGGGLVLDGTLYTGRSGNAGALGSMPVPVDGGTSQLLQVASLSVLESAVAGSGEAAASLWDDPREWRFDDARLADWIDGAATGLAHVAASAAALLDLDAMVIDGWMPAEARQRLVEAAATALARIDTTGIAVPRIGAGTVGPDARTLGAASIPLSMRFLVDRQVPAAARAEPHDAPARAALLPDRD